MSKEEIIETLRDIDMSQRNMCDNMRGDSDSWRETMNFLETKRKMLEKRLAQL